MNIISNNDVLISKDDVVKVFKSCNFLHNDTTFKDFTISRASDKMLGFMADYLKLEIQVISKDNHKQSLHFFIKSIPKSNVAKANMVREMKLFQKEFTFYTVIKNKMKCPNIKPWSANLTTTLDEALVFEDLNVLHYETRNKFETFDEQHTLLALQTLARFHATTLIYEHQRSQQLQKSYYINDDLEKDLDRGGYRIDDSWVIQCMNGALEIVKSYSKYKLDKNALQLIENRWEDVWKAALDLGHISKDHRNVLCHRDLWNNNILFRYKKVDNFSVPDDCVLVDFQAVACQPPAGDVMLLLHCNLNPKFREANMMGFLNYYYQQLATFLDSNDLHIADIIPHKAFLNSCKEYKLWGLVASACLVPQLWIDDETATKIFSNTTTFEEILTKDKASFLRQMIETNNYDYKTKVLQVFEEIVDHYCLYDKTI